MTIFHGAHEDRGRYYGLRFSGQRSGTTTAERMLRRLRRFVLAVLPGPPPPVMHQEHPRGIFILGIDESDVARTGETLRARMGAS